MAAREALKRWRMGGFAITRVTGDGADVEVSKCQEYVFSANGWPMGGYNMVTAEPTSAPVTA